MLRGPQDDTGWGEVSLEAKYRFFDGREGRWWPSLGLLPIVKFPTAHAPHGTNVPDFGLTGLASFTLPGGFSLDANLGVNALAQRPSGYLAQGSPLPRSATTSASDGPPTRKSSPPRPPSAGRGAPSASTRVSSSC